MDKDHGAIEGTLELTKVAEEASDLEGRVFIERMQTNKRIEEDETRTKTIEGSP